MKLEVLDRGWVELVDMMGSDAKIAEVALETRGKIAKLDQHQRIIADLLHRRHMKPFEFVRLEFKVYAPNMVKAQWDTYRAQARISQSLRHTKKSAPQYYTPEWRSKRPIDASARDSKLEKFYKLADELYHEALAEGEPQELARVFLLGFSTYYTFRTNGDLRNWLHFLDERLALGAQVEIRKYAQAVKTIMENVLPITMEAWKMNNDHYTR